MLLRCLMRNFINHKKGAEMLFFYILYDKRFIRLNYLFIYCTIYIERVDLPRDGGVNSRGKGYGSRRKSNKWI